MKTDRAELIQTIDTDFGDEITIGISVSETSGKTVSLLINDGDRERVTFMNTVQALELSEALKNTVNQIINN